MTEQTTLLFPDAQISGWWEFSGSQAELERGHTEHVRSYRVVVRFWEHWCSSFTLHPTGFHIWEGLGPKDLDINILEYNFTYLQFLELELFALTRQGHTNIDIHVLPGRTT